MVKIEKISNCVKAEADRMFKKILNIKGDKIITICKHGLTSTFDISSDGKIGYDDTMDYGSILKNKFVSCLLEGESSIIVRQFTDAKCEENGFPYKNVYGFVAIDSKWVSVPKSILKNSYSKEPDIIISEI